MTPLARGLVGFVLAAAFFAAGRISLDPPELPTIVRLAGTWYVVDKSPSELTPADVAAAQSAFAIPGTLVSTAERVTIARTFNAPAPGATAGEVAYMVVFGGVQHGVAQVYVNGAFVGDEGAAESAAKDAQQHLSAFIVPTSLLRPTDNVIAVEIFSVPSEDAASSASGGRAISQLMTFDDARIAIGPLSTTRRWFDRATLWAEFFELGGVLLLVFLAGLMLVLARAKRLAGQREPLQDAARRAQGSPAGAVQQRSSDVSAEGRGIQRRAALLCAFAAAFVAERCGLTHLARSAPLLTVLLCAVAIALGGVLIRAHPVPLGAGDDASSDRRTAAMHGFATWCRRLSGPICATYALLAIAVHDSTIAAVFAPYVWVLLLFTGWLGARTLHASPTLEGQTLGASALLFVGAAGFEELGGQTHPATAAAQTAVVGAVFVLARFLRTMRENVALARLQIRENNELADALARAQASTRLKAAFLANVSHELRTPLNTIINLPEGLLEQFEDREVAVCGACAAQFELPHVDAPGGYVLKATERCSVCGGVGTLAIRRQAFFCGDARAARRYLEQIQTSGESLLAVVTDILDFSKLEAGRMAVNAHPVDVDAIVTAARNQTERLAKVQQVRVAVRRQGDLETLTTDGQKVTHVLAHLLSNAIKFSPAGATVDVEVEANQGWLTVRVIDHGIGIAPGDLPRLFQSFSQLDTSHTRKAGGAGLGLVIAERLLRLLGGSIAVESEPGEGSTFTVRVPDRAGASDP